MIVGPVAVALVGAAAGFACCSAWLIATARTEGLDPVALHWSAAMQAFFALVLAWVLLGLGGVFGASFDEVLSVDTHARWRRIAALVGMWACLAAALQTIVASLIVALRRRGRRA